MNVSPLILPSDLMATVSGECAHRPQSHIYRRTFDFAAWGDAYDGTWPLDVEVLDDKVTWPFGSPSSSNHERRLCHNPSEPSDEVPELSHTPLSCDSSDSSATLLPLNLIPELSFSSYMPDLDLFGINESHIFKDHYDPPAFPDPSFAWVDAADEATNTIHSPKPVFAYKTFQFDLDRLDPSHTPKLGRPRAFSEGDVTQHRKRRRDDEDGDEVAYSKKRRMSADVPQLFPIFPDYNCDPPMEWRRCTFSEEPCTSDPIPTMEQLFDDMYRWDDVAWSNAFRVTLDSPMQS